MGRLSGRAEELAAHLVGATLRSKVTKYDSGGRQGAFDFTLEMSDGQSAALEVTLVTDPQSVAWQGMADLEKWRWPTSTGWEFRLSGHDMPYQRARRAVLRAVELCDEWGVKGPGDLPAEVLETELEMSWLAGIGSLRRAGRDPGVSLFPHVRAEFVEQRPDFASLLETWLEVPHLPRHLEKVRSAVGVDQRHLFLIPVDDVLPSVFFTDDFPPPDRQPDGYEGLDGLWVWSNYWHRFLAMRSEWEWLSFPVGGSRPSDA